MEISQDLKNKVLKSQKNEITEHLIYEKLSLIALGNNQNILKKISDEEMNHYKFFKKFTLQDVHPDSFKVGFYYFISKFLGLNFSLRLMEKGEAFAQEFYNELVKINPNVKKIIKDEKKHEEELLNLLDKKELAYTSSIILGLNDALVELTGALAGFTLALKNNTIVAVAGLITGIAASLSMAASEYLSAKEEEGAKNPLKSSIYTGITYLIVVLLLILPYFILKNSLISLAATLLIAVFIILIFNFYISVAKNLSFKKRFFEMVSISMGVAALSFLIGLLARNLINIKI